MTATAGSVLRAAGLASPARAVRLMGEAIRRLGLDLRGLTVVTEAGTGVFGLTPVIAALAGARVRALARDSAWGSVGTIRETVAAASSLAGAAGIEVTEDRAAAFAGADVVTNLGFVRPVDEIAARALAPGAVVSLMCEGWEVRPGDIDLDACRAHGVLVLATNEHHPMCDVFRFSGPLAGRLLMEAGFELLGTRVAVVGRDAFAPAIAGWLLAAGADAYVAGNGAVRQADLDGADVVLACDYASDDLIVGPDGLVDIGRLAAVSPGATVVQFAGRIDSESILAHGLGCWPGEPVGSRRMVRTFSALGPAPVIALHAGGLKVAEIGLRARRETDVLEVAESRALESSDLVQRVGGPRGGAR